MLWLTGMIVKHAGWEQPTLRNWTPMMAPMLKRARFQSSLLMGVVREAAEQSVRVCLQCEFRLVVRPGVALEAAKKFRAGLEAHPEGPSEPV